MMGLAMAFQGDGQQGPVYLEPRADQPKQHVTLDQPLAQEDATLMQEADAFSDSGCDLAPIVFLRSIMELLYVLGSEALMNAWITECPSVAMALEVE